VGAIKSLSKAVDILRVTHGTNTPFMKELMLKLEEARAEASYKLSSKDELRDLP
jgi:SET and MYND domain-containing protein